MTLPHPFRCLAALACVASIFIINACSNACNGRIETTVLFAKRGATGGRDIYVDVINEPALGIKQTLLYEGKEFGTFPHVVILQDPESRFSSNSKICFDSYQKAARAADGDLTELEIPRLRIY